MIVNIDYRYLREYGKIHSEVLVEFLKPINKRTAVDEEKSCISHLGSLKLVDIKSVLRDVRSLITNIALCIAI